MKELSIREMQERQLAILDDISEFCQENHITYILIGGALLGAVREGKLIPWDDDIDLFMPRKDYRRFVSEFKDSERLRLLDSSRVDEYYYPFAKVCDRSTKMNENVDGLGMKPLDCLGVGIDVFPIDDYPDNKAKAIWCVFNQRALQGLSYKDFRYNDPKTIGAPMRFALSCYKKLKSLKSKRPNDYFDAMDSLWSEDPGSEKVIDTWMYQVFSRDGLFPLGSIELEGKTYAAPGNCSKFLTECYGDDYMIPKNTQPDGHGSAYLL